MTTHVRESLLCQFRSVRSATELLVDSLEPEDFVLQYSTETSPAKWHLAHTTWFFETFILAAQIPNYRCVREDASFLFNSYYNAIGDRIARDRRGLLSRPTIGEVRQYRSEVDRRIGNLVESISEAELQQLSPTLILGLNHEQQHQELILTDLKAAFAWNPTRPVYDIGRSGIGVQGASELPPFRWVERGNEVVSIGYDGAGFSFDNELPRHRVFLERFSLASRLATNGEYLAFMEDGGYEKPEFWLSDGWAAKNAAGWTAPLYWENHGGVWSSYTLSGMKPIVEFEPVVHVSFYEADAFARWSGSRLATEAEWEIVASETERQPVEVIENFVKARNYHPIAAASDFYPAVQMFGDVWEWTSSPYVAYPGYHAAAGALGEYNGKFMCNQMVLRGGSCATPRDHLRPTYRNFFPPAARWQFSGVRLARDER